MKENTTVIHKEKMKYITVENGKDYRQIAKIMTENGYSINHATARNIVMSGLFTFIKNLTKEFGLHLSDKEVQALCEDSEIQNLLPELLYKATTITGNNYQEERKTTE